MEKEAVLDTVALAKDRYIILTGATGLLGQYLLRDLLIRGHRVAAIVRGNKKSFPEERLEQIMQMWERQLGEYLPRPICIAGDITQPQCGLSDDELSWINDHGQCMLHCAASLTFHEVGGEPRRTNVEGTNNVLDLCQKTSLDEMHYISTAYVCGQRDDLVMEADLDVGQEFRNDYEKSKFLAEQAVRAADFRSLTVYRPVVITGDSKTGYTSTYHGTYLYMKLARILAQNTDPDENGTHHVPIRWGLTGDERRNITTVDWNSEVILKLYENPDAHGHTFHLGPEKPLTMREAIGFGTEFYKITGVEFLGFKDKPPHELNELERWVWANISIYGSYDFMDPRFDMTNLRRFAPHLTAPVLDKTTARRLLDYAEEDKWGRRKPPAAEPAPFDVAALLQEKKIGSSGLSTTASVGLDVLGPGGGQWNLAFTDGRLDHYEAGLPSESEKAILRIPVDTFAQWQRLGIAAAESLQSFLQNSNGSSQDLSREVAEALFN
jgi:nucleoside-diphosphate-sugar epimerase